MSELALGVIAVVIAAASLYFKYRADRQKARDDARAHLRVEPEYYNDRIMLYSEGPTHAEAPRVTGVKFGPRSRMKPKKLLEQWGLSSILPAGSKYPLPVRPREGVGDWIELTLEWKNADGTPGRQTQRVHWAG